MTIYAFRFVTKEDPNFIYWGEAVVDKFFVGWETQYKDERLYPASSYPVEYSLKEMRQYFEDGTWLAVE